ncbi:unnamed protein product [Caenorhabditis brenneri]
MMSFLCCCLKKKVHPKAEPDLFDVFANASKEGAKGISGEHPAKLELIFEETGWDCVEVEYDGGLKKFNLVEAVTKRDVGKLFRKPDGTADYYYDTEQNGRKKIFERLCHIFENHYTIVIRFSDPKRFIHELCNFDKVFEAATLRINKPRTTGKELDFIMEKFKKIDFLILETRIPDAYHMFPTKYQHSIVARKLKLKFEDLEKIESEFLTLFEANFTSEDMNRFLKNWMEKKTPKKLKWFQILRFPKSEEVLFKDLNLTNWDPKNRGSEFEVIDNVAMDCTKDLDLERDDGVWASLATTPGMFNFAVWYDRFPKFKKECMKVFRRADFPDGKDKVEE